MNENRFDELITRWSAGSLSAKEARELDGLLYTGSEARRHFRSHANLDAALREWAEERATATPWPQPRGLAMPARTFGGRTLAAAAAMLLLGASWIWIARHRSPEAVAAVAAETTAQGCAVLTQMLDAQFLKTTHASGETLAPGKFQLTQGWAQIEFFSGATLLVEGAAELEIVSSWEARCLSGKVRVHVPPAAHGFRLHTPDAQLVDLGTEFAVNVQAGGKLADVHVFEGEVIAHPSAGAEMSLREGQSLRGAARAALDPAQFLGMGQLQKLITERQQQRLKEWQQWSEQIRRDPRLVAYYPLRHFAQWERLVNDAAEPHNLAHNGGAVGAAWTQGRWPGKDALQFKRPGDRVRLNLDGTFHAVTLMGWVRVDRLDHKYNALLLTDGYDPGEPHWQISEDGRLMFSVIYPDPANPTQRRNQIYYSPAVLAAAAGERWHHLAVTYDNQSGEAVQYFDGEPVSREVSPFHTPGRPLSFGPCELGNWGLPTEGHRFPIRNLDGCLDEFAIYSERLSDAEIREHFEHGKAD